MKKLHYWLNAKRMIWKSKLEAFDPGAALRELILIVAGILIAFAINNWNDERKQRNNEVKMLKELKASLTNDLRDIEGNLSGLGQMIKSKEIIIKSEQKGYDDSLHQHLNRVLYTDIYLVVNRGSFESLKSLGLHLISNDSLRLKIINLYEYDYKIQERNETLRGEYVFNKVAEFAKEVMLLHEEKTGRPERFTNLFRNTDFKVVLYQMYNFDGFKEQQYRFFDKTLRQLIADLDREIERLE